MLIVIVACIAMADVATLLGYAVKDDGGWCGRTLTEQGFTRRGWGIGMAG